MEEINTEQGEVIPRNIREIMRKQIKDWEKKDKMFVSTRASKYVNQCLQTESCVTLTAPAGVGKSFICRHAALFLQKNGYKIIPVYAPTDIRDYYQPGRQTVFVVDDICGNFIASQQQIEKWKQMIPVINTIMSDTCCRIIVSCRLQVYLDDKFKILSPFKSFECNLISDKLCLTFDEKTNIAKSYIGTSVKNIDLSQSNDFFPLLCSLYHEKNNLDIKEFFKNPFVVYKNELDKLSEYGDEGNYKICGLALCVIFNNQLGEKWFQDRLTNEQRHIIKNVCNACEISKSTPKSKLKKALETLNGTFIRKQNGMYRTVHDKMFDFLAHYFGEKMIYCLIDNGNSDLIHERFVWKKSPDEKSSNIDFIIEIPDGYLESYLKRLNNDWSAGNVLSVFDNANMKMSLFRQQLLQYLKKLDKEKQNALVNTSDTVLPIGNWGSGTTPLISSCFYGYTDMVQWILHYTVDVDKCSNNKANGLVYASEKGHTDIVKLLLEMNPNVDLCCYYGNTPLIQASQCGHTDVVRLLLQKDPKVDQCDFIGCNALLEASHNGHIDIVQLLLGKKAECNICSHSKQSMIYTISNHPTETLDDYKRYMFERLVQNNSPNVTDYFRRKPIDPFDVLGGSSPLHIACFMGRIDVVRCLLDHNANINITKEDGTTPLFYACEVGHDDLVHLLLDKAADTELCRFDDKSPLNIATENRHDSIVMILTEHRKKGVHSLTNLFLCSEVRTPIVSHLYPDEF